MWNNGLLSLVSPAMCNNGLLSVLQCVITACCQWPVLQCVITACCQWSVLQCVITACCQWPVLQCGISFCLLLVFAKQTGFAGLFGWDCTVAAYILPRLLILVKPSWSSHPGQATILVKPLYWSSHPTGQAAILVKLSY